MRIRSLPLVVGAFTTPLAGCDLGLVDSPAEATGVAVHIAMVADALAETFTGTVVIAPGNGLDGTRVPMDPRLWVNDTPVYPTATGGDLSYTFSEPLSSSLRILNIQPPPFPEVSCSPDSVVVAVLTVAAPDTITLEATASITLQVAGGADAGKASGLAAHRSAVRWRATFVPDSSSAAAGSSTVTIDAQGSLSSSVDLPAILLGPDFSAGRLSFQVWAVTDLYSPDSQCRVSVERTATAEAEVLIQARE